MLRSQTPNLQPPLIRTRTIPPGLNAPALGTDPADSKATWPPFNDRAPDGIAYPRKKGLRWWTSMKSP